MKFLWFKKNTGFCISKGGGDLRNFYMFKERIQFGGTPQDKEYLKRDKSR